VKRAAFNTGKPHQAAVATWARKRLVDDGGRPYVDGTGAEHAEQVGCLFADGVGLGKTWEALAAVALLLDKRDWRKRRHRARRARSRRRRRIYHRRREAHVLILVPPGLVAKWASELGNRALDGFSARLRRWAKQRSRRFVTRTLTESYFEIRRRGDLKKLPHGSKKHGRYVLPAGTYICNWNVFLGPGGVGLDRVTALKNQHWEVVVVDEAHHGRARKALDKLQHAAQTLLLTATPFQLDMTELHGLTRHLLVGKVGQHKVLARGAVREYAKAAEGAFEGSDPPTRAQRTAAEGVLGQLVACSRVGRQRRHYFAIDLEGKANEITPPTDLEAGDLPGIFERGIRSPDDFAEWYLGRRLELARREGGEQPRHVAIELQKLLSVRKPPAPLGPRVDRKHGRRSIPTRAPWLSATRRRHWSSVLVPVLARRVARRCGRPRQAHFLEATARTSQDGRRKEKCMELAIYLLGIMSGVFVTVATVHAFQLRRGGATSGGPACRAGCRAVRRMECGRAPHRRCVPLRCRVQLPDLADPERLRGVAATSSKPRGLRRLPGASQARGR